MLAIVLATTLPTAIVIGGRRFCGTANSFGAPGDGSDLLSQLWFSGCELESLRAATCSCQRPEVSKHALQVRGILANRGSSGEARMLPTRAAEQGVK